AQADKQIWEETDEDADQNRTRFSPCHRYGNSGSQRAASAVSTSDNAVWTAHWARGSQKSDGGRGGGVGEEQLGMAIAILDSTGHIVMLHKLDNTQYGSIAVAEDKARSALYYRRPSKVFEDLVAQGGLGMRTLALRGATPLEGGIPLIADGKIIGAIGVSGAT